MMKYIIINLDLLQDFSIEEALIISIVKYHAENDLKTSYQKIADLIKKSRRQVINLTKSVVKKFHQKWCKNFTSNSEKISPFINNIKYIDKDYLHNLYLIFKSLKENYKEEEKFGTKVPNPLPDDKETISFTNRDSNTLSFTNTLPNGNVLQNDNVLEVYEMNKKNISDCEKLHNIKDEIIKREKEILNRKPLTVNNVYRQYILFCSEKGIAYDNDLPKSKIGMIKKGIKFFKTNKVEPYEFFENVFNRWEALADLLGMKKIFNFYDLFYNIEEIMTEMMREDYKIDMTKIGATII